MHPAEDCIRNRHPPTACYDSGGGEVNGFHPIKGKCTWWREVPRDEDVYDVRIKAEDKRIACTCFVEGEYWEFPTSQVPPQCPRWRQCRYYIKHG